MEKYLALVICGFLSISSVAADEYASTLKRATIIKSEAMNKAIGLCGPAVETVQFPDDEFVNGTTRMVTREMTISVSWTGGCAEGKRDGAGVLNLRTQDNHFGADSTMQSQSEGAFIKGNQVGLWCVTQFTSLINGKPNRGRDDVGCRVRGPGGIPGKFRKLADGRWQEFTSEGIPVEPPVFLAAGTLETLSAKALAGTPDEKMKIVMQSSVLDGLVRGEKIEWQLGGQATSLKGKRVAIVLSSRTIAELERFKSERQALIDATAGIQDKEMQTIRTQLIAVSNPDRLLTIVAKVLLRHAKEAQPMDDLAGLRKGDFDYALVVDWKSMTRFDLLDKYANFPGVVKNMWGENSVPVLAGDSLSGILISPELKAVRKIELLPNILKKFNSGWGRYQAGSRQDYIYMLYKYFSDYWGEEVDSLGIIGSRFEFQCCR